MNRAGLRHRSDWIRFAILTTFFSSAGAFSAVPLVLRFRRYARERIQSGSRITNAPHGGIGKFPTSKPRSPRPQTLRWLNGARGHASDVRANAKTPADSVLSTGACFTSAKCGRTLLAIFDHLALKVGLVLACTRTLHARTLRVSITLICYRTPACVAENSRASFGTHDIRHVRTDVAIPFRHVLLGMSNKDSVG